MSKMPVRPFWDMVEVESARARTRVHEAERRRRRDAEIRSLDERIAEEIERARQSGELRSAPSYGKPLAAIEGWAETPAELRQPFRILHNAGVAPPEVALFHRRAALREELAACTDEEERRRLGTRLSELEQLIALRLESLRVSKSL